jgi:hypothetical protein
MGQAPQHVVLLLHTASQCCQGGQTDDTHLLCLSAGAVVCTVAQLVLACEQLPPDDEHHTPGRYCCTGDPIQH